MPDENATQPRIAPCSGDRIAISAYLGDSNKFDNAIAGFARIYIDQNQRDHATLAAAVSAGRVQAQPVGSTESATS